MKKRSKTNSFLLKLTRYKFFKKHYDLLNKIGQIFYKTIFTFNLHSGSVNAGYIAFSIIFAIFPFMIFFTMIIGVIGQTEIGIKFMDILQMSLPNEIFSTLLPIVDDVINSSKTGVLSIATFTLIWSASSLVVGLNIVLNKAYGIKVKKTYFLARLTNVLKFLIVISLIIVAIFSTIILPKILTLISIIIPINYSPDNILIILKPLLLITFLLLTIIMIYYVIPSVQFKIKDIIWGSVFTLVGWMISLKAFTFYIEKMAKFQLIYGSLAGIIITLYFFQIMAMILIFGAELNYNIVKSR